ncbi:MAG TPA: hypothetical protein GX513_14045 [Firmicutes bacterium]|nr:hypothetical protein [Bacillota bacterium]
MKYALFLGCSVPVRAPGYEISARRVAAELGIELVDIPSFACCGFPLQPVDREVTLLMAARNLALAEEQGLDVCTLCSACTGVLTAASRQLADSRDLRARVNEKLLPTGHVYEGRVRARHFARLLAEDVAPGHLEAARRRDLVDLALAIHYGCHYLRPAELYGDEDDPESPHTLHDLLRTAGVTVVDYENPGSCCGGGVLGVDEDLALAMAQGKVEAVTRAGAGGLVVACPFCSIMYGSNQRKLEKRAGKKFDLPVLFYPQVVGLALGLDPEELGMGLNPVKAKGLLAQVAAAPPYQGRGR